MRFLSKFLLVSITGLAVMVAAFAGIGISIIDDVLYQNSIRVLNARIGSVTRSLETRPVQAPVSPNAVLETMAPFRGATGDSYFVHKLDGARLYPPASDLFVPFSDTTITRLIAEQNGGGWIGVGGSRYLSRFVVLPAQNILVGARIPEATVFAGRSRYLMALAGTVLALLLIGAALAYLTGRSLTRRINLTQSALESISAGEFGVRIAGADGGDGGDAISVIQRRINDMADIFARRASEREAATRWLEENEKRFRDFAEAASDAFWETNADHRYTFFANPGHDFGNFQTTDSIIGTIRGQYFFDDPVFNTPEWTKHVDDLNHHRVIRNFEFSGQYPDGKIFHRLSSAIPLFDENAKFTGYRGTTTDITARIETERKLENLVSNLPGLVFQRLLHPDDRIEYSYFSTSAVRWLGERSDEAKLAAWQSGDIAHPEDREAVRRSIIDNARTGKAFSTEFRGITDTGDIVWLRTLCATPTLLPDGVVVQDGVVFDITDFKTAEHEARLLEQRLVDFAAAASDTLWETDTEHRLTWMSYPESTGNRYFSTSVMVGRRRWEFPGVAPEDSPLWAPLLEALDNRRPFRDFEFASELDNGRLVYRRVSGQPIFDEDGIFTGYRGVSSNITESVEREREAGETQQRLIDAIEASDQGIVLFGPDDRLIFASRYSLDISPHLTEVFVPGISYENMIRTAAESGNFPDAAQNSEDWVQARLKYHLDPQGAFTNISIDDRHIEIREERLSNGGSIIRQTDVTEQFLAQKALSESQERFRNFAEASSDWLWETDADFRFTSASGGSVGSEDAKPQDFIGRTRWDFLSIDIERDEKWRDHLDDLIAHKPFRNFRFSRIGPEGRILHRSTSGVPYYDPVSGSFLGYRGTTADITDQVEAEQRYRTLIEQSPMPMPMMVHDTRFVSYLNAAAVKMYGANSAADIMGKPVINYIHPDERADFKLRLADIMDNGQVTSLAEQRRLRIDGSEISVMTRGVPIMWDGDRAVLATLIDVTDRVQAERQYRELIENAPMALSVDDGEHFIFVNQAFAEMFGTSGPEEIIGREITDMADPDELEEFHDRVRAVTQYRRRLPVTQLKRHRFDGSDLTVLSRGVPIQWEGLPATLGIQVDISERIEAEKALEDSEERFRNLVEGSRQGVLLHVDFEPVFVNAALVEMFGYESENELLALPSVLDLVAPEAREKWRDNRTARLSGLDVEDDYEFAGLRKDGSKIVLHMTVRLVNWENRIALQGTMIDVTRRREAEARIRESEERFRLLTSTSPVGIFVTDADGHCEYINEAYEKMSGLTSAQASGQGWAQAVHPEDKDRVFEDWYAGVRAERPFRTEFRFLRADGTVTWAIAQAVTQRDSSGKTLRFIGAITDVTGRVRAELARKKSDDRFRTLTTLSPVGVFLTDEDGRVEYVNEALSGMLHMRPQEAFGHKWMAGIHRDDRQDLVQAWEQAYSATGSLEMELRMGDGTDQIRWVLIQASPFDAGDARTGYVGAVTDITERRAAEEQLRQVQKMDAIGQLTGGIAHDFNNLLAIVQGNLELLRERAPENERLTSLINAAHGAARRGAVLNQRLLAFARRQPLTPSTCDMNHVVNEMAGLFVRTLGDNVELQTRFAEGLWPGNIDPNGLETAVLNLAINARDAMPDGGNLTITTANKTFGPDRPAPDQDIPHGDYVMLQVSDSGMGMDTETLEKAFDPFYTTKAWAKAAAWA
jgi:PAS domain S-box-containing protein